MTSIVLGANNKVGSFSYYSEVNNIAVVQNIYPQDINGDGIDEIFFAGVETQPNTPETYTNTSVHIFGWQNGRLREITNQWLPNNTNQVEAVADVAFGDFNGDGLIDLFLGGGSDMEHPVNHYQLINKGSYFEKKIIGKESWTHDLDSFDINHDGYMDVFVTGYGTAPSIYLGSADGLNQNIDIDIGGSGVAIADFLGDGSLSAIVVDYTSTNEPNDTWLFKFVNDPSGLHPDLRYVSTLPMPRLELSKYNNLAKGFYDNSHDVRAEPFDFTYDGLMDVIVFSRGGWNGKEWVQLSEVQFLKNLGNGIFEDVTEDILIGYNNNSFSAYNPILKDFNGDGLIDIFGSDSSWEGTNDSTFLLMQAANATFVDSGRKQFSSILDMHSGISSIAKGPMGDFFLISSSQSYEYNPTQNLITNVFSSKISFRENKAPTLIKPLEDLDATEGKAISYSIVTSFRDTDKSDALSYSLTLEDGTSLPEWLSFNLSSKKLVGTMPYNTDSNLIVKVTATDLFGLAISDSFSINVKNVTNIKGTRRDEIISSGLDNETINGGLGKDTLTGGAGNDSFVFNSKLGASNVDTITDFTPGIDKIALGKNIFKAYARDKTIQASNLVYGDSAIDSNDYIIYDQTTGKLYYDSDGSGTKSQAIQIALIGTSSHPLLTSNDFTVV